MPYSNASTRFFICLLCFIPFLAGSCKKELKSDIDLSQKSVEEFRKYLAGKWELYYGYGGLGGLSQFQEYPRGYLMVVKLNKTDSVFSYKNDTLVGQSEVKWIKVDNYDGQGPRTLIDINMPCLAAIYRDSLHLTLAFVSDASTAVWARK